MTITSKTQNNIIIFTVEGDIDLFSSKEMKESLIQALAGSYNGIIIDLKQVTYLDSMGVACLLFAFSEAKKKNIKIFFSNVEGMPRKVIQLTKLDSYFPIVDSTEKALTEIGE